MFKNSIFVFYMNKQQALKKHYRDYGYYIRQYEDADTQVIINEDPNLKPIIINLPEPPDWINIEGFGKNKKDQKWRPPQIPKALVKLKNECDTIEQAYEVLQTQQFKYKEEIKWLKTQWWHRLHGYWFFNNGIPTYLSPDHFYYLSWWNLDIGLPTYRDRDRKTWIADKFLEDCKIDFAYKDKEGYAIANEDGTYDMVDKGHYVFIGLLYSKGRSEGATYRAECKNCNKTTLFVEGESGIQSRDDIDSKKVFTEKLVRPFNKLPFFFKPLTISDTLTQGKLVFDAINQKMKGGTIANIKSGLQSRITFGPGTEGHYDGSRLIFYHADEIAKMERVDLLKRHNIIKDCLRKQDERYGWSWYTSTVGEMTTGGGIQFKYLSDQSSFYQRNENGSTISGLVTIFVTSAEGYGKEMDEYGNSLKESAMTKILAERNGYLAVSDMIGWAEAVRHNPLYYEENFISNPTENNINIYFVETRLKQVRMNPLDFITPGYFKWENDLRDGRVIWVPTPEVNYRKAKFNISLLPIPEKTNKREYKNGSWQPIGDKFISGGDAYRFDQGNKRYLSDGGGYVFQMRDRSVDVNEFDTLKWSTYKTVCDYLHRPTTKPEYLEDMLMMCVYYGCMMYPESVIIDIQEYFIMRGYKGYLIYDTDNRGKVKPNAGYYSAKENVYNCVRDYVQLHGLRERHPRVLEQQKSIQGVAGLTDCDLFAAQGGALLAVKNMVDKEQSQEMKKRMDSHQGYKRDIIKVIRF